MARRSLQFSIALALALLVAACGWFKDKGTLNVALIGSPEEMFAKGIRLTQAGQQLRGATVDGLVDFDTTGQVMPALADRWIVTDDGRSYIFRVREGTWPDGTELTGESVRDALRRTLRGLSGTSLGLDFAPVEDVRAMAGRVVEIRLSAPMPDLLQLLAQPELALFRNGHGSGLLKLHREGDIARLTAVPPEKRGLPAIEGWMDTVRKLEVRAFPARKAIALFDEGEVDVVLGGRMEFLPQAADTGPLSRGTIRMDRVFGLFGMQVRSGEGFLADASRREALALAIDRDKLVQPFNVSGWQATTRIVAPGLPNDPGIAGERWENLAMPQRQAEAARRVQAWRGANGGAAVTLSLSLPEGPGADLVFASLRDDLAAAGIGLRRVGPDARADLEMIDREARYAGAGWFLNQFNCSLKAGLCSPEADSRVKESLSAADAAGRTALLARAEADLTAANVFIPFGAPLRWSLVRGNVQGFETNIWGVHPLSALALATR